MLIGELAERIGTRTCGITNSTAWCERAARQVDATMDQLAALREQLLARLRAAPPKCEFH
ncbi:hypothetical protein [Nocardia arthritidis]|uniref:Uncharacterized protein n=1 Tax=Nocardia arthritidis TaxID=228602 RepID=A0A6G9YC49_9NOCA|nr:hypothetical protein [Nocardia arthritidis]QIS10801.1 hypothetical protein F5544_14580 [Nocardia arthritidis]